MSEQSSSARISEAAERNLTAFFELWGSSRFVIALNSRRLRWIDCNLEFSYFNNVFFTRLKSDEADEVIEELLSHFESRGLTFEWNVFSGSKPSNLSAKLLNHGFVFDGDKPAMIINLHKIRKSTSQLKDLEIRKVEDDGSLETFMNVTAESFTVSRRDCKTFLKILRDLRVGSSSRFECYLGYLARKPVATSALLRAAGLAGVYWVGTVPEARRKGVATDMTRRILVDARDAGYHFATLQASQMGEPVYRSLGFRNCFSFKVFLHKHL